MELSDQELEAEMARLDARFLELRSEIVERGHGHAAEVADEFADVQRARMAAHTERANRGL